MFESIEAALNLGDGAAALAAAQDVVAQHPQNARALHLLGMAQRLCGDAEGASVSFDRAISLAPDNAQIHFSRAVLALSGNDVEAAGAALDQTVAHNPNSLPAYVLRGLTALAQGNQATAESQLRLAQRVNPEHPHVLALQGNITLTFGAPSDALRPLTRAVQLAPQDVFSLSCLGMAFLAAGNPAFAEETLRRALAISPGARRLRWALIDALRRQDRFADVLAEAELILAADPSDTGALALRGDLRLAGGDLAGALASYRSLLAGSSNPGPALRLLLTNLLRSGAADSARELFEELVAAQPDADGVWQVGLMLEADEPEALRAYVARWQALCPESHAAWQTLAVSNERFADLTGAEEAADHLLGLDPGNAAAHFIKLRAEMRRQPSAALARAEQLRDAARSPAAQRAGLVWRGFACDALAHYETAVQSWIEAGRLPMTARPLPNPAPRVPEAQPSDDGVAPRLLWGPPGSPVGQIVASLNGIAGFAVLDDRLGTRPRPDGLGPDRPDGVFANQAQWRAVAAHVGIDVSRVLDWLPHYDARHAAQLPDARLLAVIADPRDLLLNWLAYGSPQEYFVPLPTEAAAWLAQILLPLADRIEAARPGDLIIRHEKLESDPKACGAALADFCDLPEPLDGERVAEAGQGLGGQTYSFASGHWRDYADALREAFAPLHAIAARLGYPAG